MLKFVLIIPWIFSNTPLLGNCLYKKTMFSLVKTFVTCRLSIILEFLGFFVLLLNFALPITILCDMLTLVLLIFFSPPGKTKRHQKHSNKAYLHYFCAVFFKHPRVFMKIKGCIYFFSRQLQKTNYSLLTRGSPKRR